MRVNRCGEVAGLLAAYVEGEVSAAEAARLRAHLEVCRACRAEEAQYRAALGALGSAPAPVAPPGMLAEFHTRLDASRRPAPRPAPLRLRWAAAALALLVVGAAGASVWRALAPPVLPPEPVVARVPAPAPPAPSVSIPRVEPQSAALPPPSRVEPRETQTARPAPAAAYRPPARERPRPRVVRDAEPREPRREEARPLVVPLDPRIDDGMTPLADEQVRIGGHVTHVRTATGEDSRGRKLVRVEIVTRPAAEVAEPAPDPQTPFGGADAAE